jgi:hypothetical protein
MFEKFAASMKTLDNFNWYLVVLLSHSPLIGRRKICRNVPVHVIGRFTKQFQDHRKGLRTKFEVLQ